MCRTFSPTTRCPTTSWKSLGDVLTSVEVRPLGPDDDLEAELDLRRRAFGPISPGRRQAWLDSVQGSIDAGAMVGAFDGGRLIGSARYHIMRQWWHGHSLPMAGIAGVKVAPEERGRGVGTAMTAALLDDIAGRGYPLSTLFPYTASIYRSLGWEIGGRRYETVLPATALVALQGPDQLEPPDLAAPTVRRASPADAAAIVDVKGLAHERLRHCGPNTREPWVLRDWLDDEDHFAYLADDGFLSYRWSGDMEELRVEELIATSAATARTFWRILASNAHMVNRVRAWLAPDDPVTWRTRDADTELHATDAWMLRVVDAPTAIAGRGFPAGASVSLALDITDRARPANSGRWSLEVSGGAASLTRLGDAPPVPDSTVPDSTVPDSPLPGVAGALSVGARGFAALYAGVPVPTLRLAGLAAGGDAATDDALSSAFHGPAFTIDEY
jgi:predicted acetyltransferase